MKAIKEFVIELMGSDYSEEDFQLTMTSKSQGAANNERLEFLGNAVLNMHLANKAFRSSSKLSPGEMSRACNHVRSDDFLNNVGREHGLDKLIRVGPSVKGGKVEDKMVSTAFEALIGMLYYKAGYDIAARFIDEYIDTADSKIKEYMVKDPVTRLKEHCEKNKIISVEKEEWMEPDGPYKFTITINGHEGVGNGGSKRNAEREASEKILEFLESR